MFDSGTIKVLSALSHSVPLIALLGCSLTLNIIQARRITVLEGAIAVLKSEGTLKPGSAVPPISAYDLTGELQTIPVAQTSKPTVLYVFTPQCAWCSRNLSNIRALYDAVSEQYAIVGISLSDRNLAAYLAASGFRFSVYATPLPAVIKVYRLGSTPRTIVVSPEGKVVKSWIGAYDRMLGKEIEEFFNVRLPGLSGL
jgi:peroxiredoxin